jgi:hypothetical protein
VKVGALVFVGRRGRKGGGREGKIMNGRGLE